MSRLIARIPRSLFASRTRPHSLDEASTKYPGRCCRSCSRGFCKRENCDRCSAAIMGGFTKEATPEDARMHSVAESWMAHVKLGVLHAALRHAVEDQPKQHGKEEDRADAEGLVMVPLGKQ